MAVQAQYPSNVLLLNRNVQEGHDYSLQQQPGGGGLFLDQSHMLFNNGGSSTINPRKRSREIVPAATTTTTTGGGMIATPTTTTTINPFFCMQSTHSQPQLIDLSLLHHHHNNNTNTTNSQQNTMVSTGLRLSLSEQQQLQQNHQHFQHHHQPQNFITQSSAFVSLLSDDFASHTKRQREELDQLLQAQGEQLRRTLAEKRQRHYRALLGVAEESLARRVREKEVEVEKASRRNAELEARAAQLSMEAQVWQAKARAQEATAASLQAQLQQAIMCGGGDMAVGCGGGVEGGVAEDAESAYVDPERVSGPSCKGCGKRVASVVVLPCRHFCLCTECDQVAQTCPLCLHVRNSSVEVFLC